MSLDNAIRYAKALSKYDIFSIQDARNLIGYGGMRPYRDWLQFDCALSYGLVQYLRTLDIAAGLGFRGNESYPGLFQPFGGFPDGVKVIDGYVTLPDLPGISFEGKAGLVAHMQTLSA